MHGTLVVSIPPEIIEDMELSDCEMVEVCLTKKPHVTMDHTVSIGVLSTKDVAEVFG